MTGPAHQISRRSANALLAGALAWPCLGVGTQQISSHCTKVAQDALISIFENSRSASEIGSMCLKSVMVGARTTEDLANAIIVATECDTEALKSMQTLRQRISNRVRNDFAEGAVINVEGWVLSVTEAHLYALAALATTAAPMARA